MVTIYLSSTFKDLKDSREQVYHTLHMMGYSVFAMEEYVASDERPLDKCLADVANSDLYIGIFAWRYGYIPPKSNRNHKSITELEYRKASNMRKSRLIFMLSEEASWPAIYMDAHNGEDKGECIKRFRDELKQERTVKSFDTVYNLTTLVATSVNEWEKKRRTNAAKAALLRPQLNKKKQSSGQPSQQGLSDIEIAQRKELLLSYKDILQQIQNRLLIMDMYNSNQDAMKTIRQELNQVFTEVKKPVNKVIVEAIFISTGTFSENVKRVWRELGIALDMLTLLNEKDMQVEERVKIVGQFYDSLSVCHEKTDEALQQFLP